MVMALTEEEKRRSEESKAKALARRNKSVATAQKNPSDSIVHDSNTNNSNRVQTQAKQNVNPSCQTS